MLASPPAAVLLRGVLLPEQSATTRGRRAYRTADVQLQDGVIKAIGQDLPQEGLVVDCSNKMLLPGCAYLREGPCSPP
jgi:cytosine/adenosine deaminase-related metal-dependent hydrolase